jgi:hypothetical protein
VSTPIIPGYIDGPTPATLADLWPRPTGDYPDDLWPIDVLESVLPEPTGWLTVCEHYSTQQGHGGRGCVLVHPASIPESLADATWSGRDLGTFSVWESFDGSSGFEAGLLRPADAA